MVAKFAPWLKPSRPSNGPSSVVAERALFSVQRVTQHVCGPLRTVDGGNAVRDSGVNLVVAVAACDALWTQSGSVSVDATSCCAPRTSTGGTTLRRRFM